MSKSSPSLAAPAHIAPEVIEPLEMEIALQGHLATEQPGSATEALVCASGFVLSTCMGSPQSYGKIVEQELFRMAIPDPKSNETQALAADLELATHRSFELGDEGREEFRAGAALLHFCLRVSRQTLGLSEPADSPDNPWVPPSNVRSLVEGEMAKALFASDSTPASRAAKPLLTIGRQAHEGARWVLSALARRNPRILLAYTHEESRPRDRGQAQAPQGRRHPGPTDQLSVRRSRTRRPR